MDYKHMFEESREQLGTVKEATGLEMNMMYDVKCTGLEPPPEERVEDEHREEYSEARAVRERWISSYNE